MKKILAGIAVVVLLFSAGVGIRAHAQAVTAATPYTFSTTGTSVNCPAVAPGVSQWCFTTDKGALQSLNGSAWAVLGAVGPQGPAGPTGATGATGPAGPAGTASNVALTINGTTKTLPASFTLQTPNTVTAN